MRTIPYDKIGAIIPNEDIIDIVTRKHQKPQIEKSDKYSKSSSFVFILAWSITRI